MVAEATAAEFGLDSPAPDGPTTASEGEPLRAVPTSNSHAFMRNDDETVLANSFVLPTESLQDVALTVRARPLLPA
jgi:hypothetical protein